MSFRERGQQRVLLPFGLDYADITQISQGEDLQFQIPINGPLNKHEDESTKQFLSFSELMKNSSFYTGSLASYSNTSASKKESVYLEGGVNDGIKRYSDKYRKQIKVGRSIDDHPFILDFYPDELHNVMVSKKNKKTKRSLFLSSYTKGEDKDLANLIKLSEEEKQKELMQRLNNVDENDEEIPEEEEEEEDEEFEEDEDDDYNAEKYFDDGEDDYGDEDEGNDEAAF